MQGEFRPAFAPFDDDHAGWAAEIFVESGAVDLLRRVEAVEIEMREREPAAHHHGHLLEDTEVADLEILEIGGAGVARLHEDEASAAVLAAALEEGLSQLKGVPLLTVSGKTGKGIDQLLGAAFEIRDNWSRRVTTGELNRWFERAIEANPPPAPGGKRIW